jgi:hypothetical protein
MSDIPQFGDATTSLAGDAASPTGDVDVSAGDLLASPNFGICDTTRHVRDQLFLVPVPVQVPVTLFIWSRSRFWSC